MKIIALRYGVVMGINLAVLSRFQQIADIPLLPSGALKKFYFQARLGLKREEPLLEKIKIEHLVPVLNLHRVTAEMDPYWGAVKPELFDELIRYLKKRFRLVTFTELAEKGDPSDQLPPLVLSFDDGFHDFLEYAVPVLKRHGVRANMNIIPKFCESGTLPWNIQLYDFLQRAPKSLIREISLPGFTMNTNLVTDRQRSRFGIGISAFFKNRSYSERDALWKSMASLLEKWGQKPQFRMMSTGEIRQIMGEHEIGAHSYGHDSMGFESMEYFVKDFEACKNYFEDKLNSPLRIYAFPNGSYRPEQAEKLLSLGVEQVLLVGEKFTFPKNRVHKRFTIYGDSLGELVFRSFGDRLV